MEILNPTIELMGLEVREPVTTATDFLTGIVSFISFLLLSSMRSDSRVVYLFRGYFLLMSISMAFAAFAGHAFQGYLSWEWKMVGWSFGALAICSLELFSVSLLSEKLGEKYSRWVRSFIILHVILFFCCLAYPPTRSFSTVKINAAIGLIGVVLPLHAYNYYLTKSKGSRWVLVAMIWSLIPAYIFNMEVSYSRWFNFHDISHVLMSIYTIYLYLGARNFARST